MPKITRPVQVNDKFELSHDEVVSAIVMYMKTLPQPRNATRDSIRVHLTTGNQFTASGELLPDLIPRES